MILISNNNGTYSEWQHTWQKLGPTNDRIKSGSIIVAPQQFHMIKIYKISISNDYFILYVTVSFFKFGLKVNWGRPLVTNIRAMLHLDRFFKVGFYQSNHGLSI